MSKAKTGTTARKDQRAQPEGSGELEDQTYEETEQSGDGGTDDFG